MLDCYAPWISSEFDEVMLELESLLNGGGSESVMQLFLEKHAYLVLQAPPIYDHYICVTQAKLGGDLQTDFALYGSCNGPWWNTC